MHFTAEHFTAEHSMARRTSRQQRTQSSGTAHFRAYASWQRVDNLGNYNDGVDLGVCAWQAWMTLLAPAVITLTFCSRAASTTPPAATVQFTPIRPRPRICTHAAYREIVVVH
jgi:hypothetical protein